MGEEAEEHSGGPSSTNKFDSRILWLQTRRTAGQASHLLQHPRIPFYQLLPRLLLELQRQHLSILLRLRKPKHQITHSERQVQLPTHLELPRNPFNLLPPRISLASHPGHQLKKLPKTLPWVSLAHLQTHSPHHPRQMASSIAYQPPSLHQVHQIPTHLVPPRVLNPLPSLRHHSGHRRLHLVHLVHQPQQRLRSLSRDRPIPLHLERLRKVTPFTLQPPLELQRIHLVHPHLP